MLQLKVLIIELSAINTLSTRPVAHGKITTLDHELLDYTMKNRAFIGKLFSTLAFPLLARAESAKVVGGLRNYVVVELEDDSSFGFLADGDVEPDSTAF